MGSLRVLRDHGQRRSVAALPGRGDPVLAEMVVASYAGRPIFVGLLQRAAGAVSAAGGGGGPLGVPAGSEPMTRRAVCANCASTDLWEPWGATPHRSTHFSGDLDDPYC